jgi:hypothetical protein
MGLLVVRFLERKHLFFHLQRIPRVFNINLVIDGSRGTGHRMVWIKLNPISFSFQNVFKVREKGERKNVGFPSKIEVVGLHANFS